MTRSLLLREILRRHISKTRRATILKFCIRNAFMAIMSHAKFHFNRLMLTLIFWHLSLRAPPPPPPLPPPRAWKIRSACFYCGPYRINLSPKQSNCIFHLRPVNFQSRCLSVSREVKDNVILCRSNWF